ncbi:lactate dehydrogenase [Pusillimonas sp. T2]|uniref:Ldh family oxidoreductase n=1 Tax=Pusillimonas sp. T2 TaxID=1548123 RepID=UPI000B9D3F63|nr:Ldh family oxidoreductase [Pusillimonas sp. T2]OXR48219.1 lactate dehydrogenase [Pusillimonas sp. T2]
MSTETISASALRAFVKALFVKQGATDADALVIADSLVGADLEGVSSHGVMLLPMYVDRVKAGSMRLSASAEIVDDLGGLVVMTANHAPGQVSAQEAVGIAIERARVHGMATVTVREAGHFGAGAYWARQMAAQGMVGMAFSNTRPLMPAPGGAKPLVGNNPLCMAFPSQQGLPVIVDMAMSASAMGKIRMADIKGESIPLGWATDASGKDTQSPAEAIKGMLLPAAGPKGFGLAVAIELLCGALSGGGIASQVKPLFGDPAEPYNCAHTFIAIDASRLNGGRGIGQQVDNLANVIRHSEKAPGIERVYAPGDLERSRRAQHNDQCCLSADLVTRLRELAQANDVAFVF